jgi:dihydrofolate synthase / folylpolyglutamate synthase
MTAITYQEALDYLYSYVDYSVERSYRYSAEVFDLQRVRQLLQALGDPQDRYPAIHIAGTKGKGSVSALLASSLQAAGYRTGLYTSPHLRRFTERIKVGGAEILPEEVARLVELMRPEAAQIDGLTTYELITVMAFLHFASQKVDYAVVEVGLGAGWTRPMSFGLWCRSSPRYPTIICICWGTAFPTLPARRPGSSSPGCRWCLLRSNLKPGRW